MLTFAPQSQTNAGSDGIKTELLRRGAAARDYFASTQAAFSAHQTETAAAFSAHQSASAGAYNANVSASAAMQQANVSLSITALNAFKLAACKF
jgi:hypothetical protein